MSSVYSSLDHSASLQQLLRRSDLWKGRSGPVVRAEAVPTGYPELDKVLLHGGWPVKGLIEFQQQNFGHGEWHLLLPSLRYLLQQAGCLVLINPPAVPYAPALAQQGIAVDRLLVIDPLQKKDWLVSVREVLAANCCVAVFCWEPKQRLLYPELRKLQLSVSQSGTLCFLLRSRAQKSAGKAYSNSPAVLRLQLQSREKGLQVQIEKQRGSYCRASLLLPWPVHLIPEVLANRTASSKARKNNNIIAFDRSA